MKSPERPKFIGAAVKRLEDPRLVTGRSRFIDDLVLPDMLHMRLVRSQLAHARIRTIDVTGVREAHPGCLVYTGEDIGTLAIRANADFPETQFSVQPLLAQGKVRFVGEPVAAVLLADAYEAEDAAELVFIDYEPLPIIVDSTSALQDGAALLFDGWKRNVFIERSRRGGDLEEVRRRTPRTIRRTYRNQRQAGVPMECRGVIAHLDPAGTELTVHSSTQIPHLLRTYLSEELNWPESRLRVIAPEVGGGFGVKGHVFAEEVLVAHLAIRTGRPVKWIEDRREHLLASIHARDHEHTLEAYFTDDGRVLGLKADITVDAGAYSIWPFTAGSDPGMVAKVLPGPYRFEGYEATWRAVATNKCPVGTYRGVGRPSAVFSLEVLMDEIAEELDIDPIELRLRNVPREFPYKNVLGFSYDKGSYVECLEKGRALLDAELKTRPREPTIRSGVGFAFFIEQTAHGTGDFSVRRVPIETGYESARVEMQPDGTVVVEVGTQCHGQGHETTLAQVAADALGVRPQDVVVRHGDTRTSPYSVGTWGSRVAALGGGAVHRASQVIAAKLLAIGAQHLQARVDQLELGDGSVRLKAEPGRAIEIRKIARMAYRHLDQLAPDQEAGLTAVAFVDGPAHGSYSNALHAAVVEIDISTGMMKLKRFVVVEDCGTIINPMIVDGQIRGGVVQGIGSAMLEEFKYSPDGQPLTATFADYLMPTAPEVPAIEIHHFQTPSDVTPLGIKGLGEGGAIGPAAAIANAVSDALGARVRETPLTRNRVWQLSAEARRKPGSP
ncbi:MAG TPA: xanthine dehydrogenase family protein molybdopterin-binding subunit [Aestuariivirgaceae bacterium]|nr:xanthine dehydrogenase family protein molybdopterin-binding subunit [Aestuariivirgaceae bacterium]